MFKSISHLQVGVLSFILFNMLATTSMQAEELKTPSIAELTTAAQTGDAEAMYNLGVRCATGKKIEADTHKALEWYQKAAEAGHARAALALGEIYEAGKLVGKDEENAARWYLKAAELGDVDAMVKVARIYAHGRGLKQSNEQAEQRTSCGVA